MTTVPLKQQEVLAYVNGHRPDAFDLSQTKLQPKHVWNYLSFLKSDDVVINVTSDQLSAYLATRDFVRSAGIIEIVKDVLRFFVSGQPSNASSWSQEQVADFVAGHSSQLQDVLSVLSSLPVFLRTKAGTYTPVREQHINSPETVGVNFCHLFADDMFLFELLPDVFSVDTHSSPYYTDLFEDYMYGGDNLVWFVTSNPNNFLVRSFAP